MKTNSTFIASITITPKKGETIPLRFQVIQEIPFPDIESRGDLNWRNTGGLFSSYGQPAQGIGEVYNCYLLASNVDNPTGNSRVEHAGYEGNPGTFSIRGQDVGELQIRLDRYHTVKVRGFNTPTPGEDSFIESQIVVPLRAFVDANRAALKAHAVARIQANMADRIREARKQLDALEAKISTAKF